MQNRGSGAKKGLPLWAFILIAGGCIFFLVVAVLFLQVGDLGNSLLSTTSTISNWSSASAVTSSIDAGETNAHYLRIGETPQDTHKTTKEDEVLNEIELQQYKNSWIVTSQQGVKVYSSPNEVASVVDLLPLATIIAGDVLTRESEHDKVTTTWLLCSYPIEGWVIVSRCLSGSESEHLVRPLDTSHAFEYLARPPAAGGVSFCANTSNYLPQTDYHGGDLTVAQSPGLRNPVHVGSLAECCTACGNTLNCAYWTHTAEGDCWLKSSVATKVSVGPQKKLISGAAPVLVGRVALGVNAAFSASNGPEITTSTHCCGFSPALSSVGRAFNLHQWSANMPLYYLNGSSSSVSSSGGEGADGKAPLTGDENMVISPPIPVREIQTALDSTFITHTSRSQDSSSDVTSKAAGAAEPGANPADAGDGVNVRLITPFTTTTAAAAAATMTLLQRERFTADWTEQQAIGNGKFGALVGGNMRAEIIPVSIAGLYVKKAVNVNAGVVAQKGPITDKAFREAREDFKQHRYTEADKKMSSYIKQNLGMFQYVADLALVYSPVPINWRDSLPLPPIITPVPNVKGGKGPPIRRNLQRPHTVSLQGRANLLHSLYDHLTYESTEEKARVGHSTPAAAATTASPRPPFGDILVSDSILDMKHGVASTSFMDAPRRNTVQSTAAPDLRSSSSREVRLHHREWYASAVDKVMVGKLSCQTNARFRAHGGGDVLQPCLNVALQLHRENYPGLTPNITIHSEMFLLSELQKKKWAKQGRNIPGVSISLQAYRFEVQVSSTRVAMLPATVMTGVVICVSSHASKSRTAQSQQKSSFEQYHHPLSADPVLVCNSADFMHIVLSVESEGNTFDSPTTPQPSTFASGDIHPTLSRLRGAAWDNVARALDKGRTQLKLDHMRHFASFMSRVDISLGSEPSTAAVGATSLHPSGSYTCSSNNLQRRIESFTSGCLNAEFTPPSPYMTADGAVQDNVDARLAGTLFQYGRYLLLSSATGAVANLQGIWADGPTAAWNGDYHLNINFQMHYWAADSVRLKEVMKPLGNFVAQLRKKGAVVAREMYGCQNTQGWVAHGFTDGDLDTSPYGDNQWALCVTCGAWAALAIWEHLIAQQITLSALVEVADTLRGVVLFFQEYMYREEKGASEEGYVMHTGPTTSPENSYIILLKGQAAPDNSPPARNLEGPLIAAARKPAAQHPSPPPPPAQAAGRVPPQHYKVNHLAWSPSIDISILRQVANAFTLSVEWALAETDKTGAAEGFSAQKLTDLRKTLEADKVLAAEFVSMIAHMPGGGLPVIDETMHDAQHQIQAHLQATARALNTGNANAKPQTAAAPIDHQPVPSAEQLVEHAEKNRWCGIGTGGCVREFPYAITVADGAAADSNTDGAAAQAVTSALPIVSETLDIGHRHFSGMHWVYPNTFTPFKESPALYRAAVNTMAAKSDNGGGHTGWSAVWEASLWARLRRPEQAFGALNKFVTKFLSPNLQSMHPPLVGKSEVDCGTCFGENYQLNVARALRKERNIKEIVHRRQLVQHRSQPDSPESHDNDKEGTGGTQDAASAETVPLMSQEDLQHMEDVTLLPRGMITSDQSKFQIDGNLGYMAAIVELLVHSHVPGTIALLPSLPSAFAAQPGHVYGLQARGDVLVSLEWAIGGSLVAAQLVFQSAHPWQVALEAHPQYSSRGGFYHSAPRTPSNAQVSLSLKVSAPNKLSIASLLQSEIDTCSVELLPGSTSEGKMGSAEHQIVFGDVSKYPCVVSLCGANVDAAHCTAAQNLMSAHLAFSSSGF